MLIDDIISVHDALEYVVVWTCTYIYLTIVSRVHKDQRIVRQIVRFYLHEWEPAAGE